MHVVGLQSVKKKEKPLASLLRVDNGVSPVTVTVDFSVILEVTLAVLSPDFVLSHLEFNPEVEVGPYFFVHEVAILSRLGYNAISINNKLIMLIHFWKTGVKLASDCSSENNWN